MAKINIHSDELAVETSDNELYRRNPDGTYTKITVGGAALVTDAMDGTSTVMVTNATVTGTAASTQLTPPLKSKCTYIATLGGDNAQAVSATIQVYGSLVPMASAGAADKVSLLSSPLSLSGTGSGNNDTVIDTDAVSVGEHYYPYIWMEVTAISGTGAKVITGRRLT